MNKLLTIVCLIISTTAIQAQKTYSITSPNGTIQINVEAAAKLKWGATYQSQIIIEPSVIALHLQTGEVAGDNVQVTSIKNENINTTIPALFYKKDTIRDNYAQLTLNCKGDYGIIFRAYNDGVAYRFFTKKKDSIIV